MKTNRLFLIVALLGTVLAGCQKAELVNNNQEPTGDQIWKISVKSVKNVGSTRALELSGSTLEGYWKNGEKVAVYFGGTKLGTLQVTSADNVDPATIEGYISKPDGLDVSSSLMLLFPGRDDDKWTYEGQDGSEPSASGTLSIMFDYLTASFTVTSIDLGNHTIAATGDTGFTSQQSMYRFGFLKGGSGDPIVVKSFVLSSNQNKIVRSRSFSAGNWVSEYGPLTMTSASAPTGNLYFMSVRNENTTLEDTYSFSVVGSDDALYEGTQVVPSAKLGNGKFLGAKAISISQKALAPEATGEISEEIKVL